MYYLKFILSICFLFLMGILFYERKKPKGLKPMKTRSVYPPSYKCLVPKIKTADQISRSVKAYTIGSRANDFNEFSRNVFNQISA